MRKNKDISFLAYHTTSSQASKYIKSPNDFKSSMSSKEWLGYGVYFWDDSINAFWWADKRNRNIGSTIFKCNLECDSDNFMDFDFTENAINFNSFVEALYNNLEHNSEELNSRLVKLKTMTADEKRCFFINLFCQKYSIKLVKRTFEDKGKNIPKSGMKISRTQLCVIDGYQEEVIKDMEVYHEKN